ncbi:hypothetical protein ACG1BZ_04790 [Microbulbifer sp. CNSA002]|uniref:hypothetical protein n=1 Tax=unclassified Microbulbifer TaxID=2619833 RepID=UPI0039B58C3F
MKYFLAFFVAYVVSRLIFSSFDFQYFLFSESFDIRKLAIDAGVFGILFFGATHAFGWLVPKKNNKSGA